MKKLLTLSFAAFLALGVQAQYQLANSDFEGLWDDVSYKASVFKTWKGVEPSGWNSFLTGSGDAKSTALSSIASGVQSIITKSTETYDNTKSQTSVQLKPYTVLGIPAQANLTNGCINLGGTTADKWIDNYNYTNVGTEGQYGAFSGKPDAIHVWVKFNSSVKYGAKVSCVLHDNTNSGYMQDPYQNFTYVNNDAGTSTTTTDYTLSSSVKLANVVAHASKTDIQNSNDWQELNIPLIYDNPDLTPSYALVTFSTSSAPGKGNANDVMWVDDFEFIYNSELESAIYDGTNIDFDNGVADMTNIVYDESKLALTSNGRGATIEKFFNSTTGILEITVKGNDISSVTSNYHAYTIAFCTPPSVVDTKEYTDDLQITINGNTGDPLQATVTVESLDNGNINFSLRNFVMWMYSEESQQLEPMPVGNINILNFPLANAGDYETFAFNGNVEIEVGDAGYQLYYYGDYFPLEESDWSGPSLGNLPLSMNGKITDNALYVTIDIDLMASMGQMVHVQFGYDFKNYVYTFGADYGTICLPTAAALPNGVKAYSCANVTNNVLELVEVSSIEANTPYILENTGSEASYTILTTEKTNNEVYTAGCLSGVLASRLAPVGSYVLQNLEGKVGFYKVAEGLQPTVGANRCYLTVPGSGVKAFYFNEDDATGIENLNVNANLNETIYNLAGQRLQKMQKGVNIINGKKILK